MRKVARPTRRELARVLKQIDQAFSGAKYPGDDGIVTDNSRSNLECAEVATAFRGRHWSEIPLETLAYENQALFFFTPEAYRFYLPAYLKGMVSHYDELDAAVAATLFSLTRPPYLKDRRDYLQRIEIFTVPQRKAIISSLQWLNEHHAEDFPLGDITKALKSLQGCSN